MSVSALASVERQNRLRVVPCGASSHPESDARLLSAPLTFTSYYERSPSQSPLQNCGNCMVYALATSNTTFRPVLFPRVIKWNKYTVEHDCYVALYSSNDKKRCGVKRPDVVRVLWQSTINPQGKLNFDRF